MNIIILFINKSYSLNYFKLIWFTEMKIRIWLQFERGPSSLSWPTDLIHVCYMNFLYIIIIIIIKSSGNLILQVHQKLTTEAQAR